MFGFSSKNAYRSLDLLGSVSGEIHHRVEAPPSEGAVEGVVAPVRAKPLHSWPQGVRSHAAIEDGDAVALCH